ncbi:MAG: DNA polymerase III subunit delta [Candidatus Pacebacteria bacterium]|nr:DNA polymerase III subunit delta [Candidatus Paceibacterota bacterium]MDD3048042.1 DNA polymerase III subunit delta [Candidatus Paceibacterota bacterium]MDD3509885.1 DNA polymerase III subunit delta [Candidatus Paceibacterota bacterium]MDD3918845.1 DNA polymerase III subunit delta [Candidatus Paceibacterota bacterium]MDD4664856.1 DNA polymerase III subunit delta [Candidatus Paceibacterota bacterium]
MIILIYGKDTYRSRERLNEIRESYNLKNKSGMNERFLDGKNLSFEEFRNEVLGLSFFNEKKLIIVQNVFSNRYLKEEIAKSVFETENIIIFHEEGKVLKQDILYKFLIKVKAKIEEYNFLDGKDLEEWVKKEVLENKGTITQEAVGLLCDYIQSDLWRQKNEIQKLIAYNSNIDEKSVKLLVNINVELDIFKTVNAIARNDKANAIKLIRKHLEKGEAVFPMLALIARQFKLMLVYKVDGKAGFYGLSSLAQKFSIEDLKRIYAKILEIDSKIKTGKIDEKMAIETLILEI